MESPQPSPLESPRRPPSPSELYPPTRFLPFPPGTYTVLPLVQACDNLTLPTGPFSAAGCRQRWEAKKGGRPSKISSAGLHGSALDDDDDDEEESTPTSFEDEFLAPFFVALPFDSSTPPALAVSATPPSTSRRSSSSSLNGRPSFSRLTPMPSLRPSSPTPSSPADHLAKPAVDGEAASKKEDKAQPIGFLRPAIVKALVEDTKAMVAMNCRPPWSFLPPLSFPPPVRRPSRSYSRRGSTSITPLGPGTPDSISRRGSSSASAANGDAELKSALEGLKMGGAGVISNEEAWKGVYAVGFADWVNEEGKDARREHVDRVVRKWKMSGEFAEVLGGWRDEEYDIYGPAPPLSPDSNPLPGGNVVFSMERSACALFGVATFGVHMTAYIEEEGQPLKLWVPRRSATKQTWPGYLDNTVAGGISAGANPYSTILRESIEEASLPPAFVASRIRAASALVYNYRTKNGWLQPEVQYVYDLKMDPLSMGEEVVKPGVNDSEVEEFMLMDLEEVVKRMCEGEFKPNCALVLIDFFIRHGYLNPESDSRYLDVAMGCRRTLALPGPA